MNAIIEAIGIVFTPYHIAVVFGGTFLGIFIGAMPGLSSVMGLSIMLPFTFMLNGQGSIMMLLGIFAGSIYGGSISAILINTPGTSASAATALDGYPMAVLHKQPGRALGISTFSSLFGGLFSCIVLCFAASLLAKIALSFNSLEYFSLAIFGISIITSVSGKSITKGLMGGILGLLFATVGADSLSTQYRFCFDVRFLKGGMSLVPVLIALFAFTQALGTVETKYNEKSSKTTIKIDRAFPSRSDLKIIMPTVLRSSVLGTLIGAIPGTGGDIASWIGYNEAKRWSKHKEDFGHGAPEGIAGSEAANNAIAGGGLVPLLSLGIPGDAGSAVMMGAFTMMGIVFGPDLFQSKPEQANSIYIGLILANIFIGILGFLMIRVFAKIINIPSMYMLPIVFAFCIVGTFALNHYKEEVYLMMIMGVIGFFLLKFGFPMPPIVLGLVLGNLAEKRLRLSLDFMSAGDNIWNHPIAITFFALSVLSLISPLFPQLKKRWNERKQHD